MNPLVELARNTVPTLAAIGYALVLLAVSFQLAGRGWEMLLWLDNAWEQRHRQDTPYGPAWEYVPPLAVWNRLTAVTLLLAAEAFLWGGIIWVLT